MRFNKFRKFLIHPIYCLFHFNATCSFCVISMFFHVFAYFRCKIIAIICNVLKNVLRYKFVTSNRKTNKLRDRQAITIHTIDIRAIRKRKGFLEKSLMLINAYYQLVIILANMQTVAYNQQLNKTHDYVLFMHTNEKRCWMEKNWNLCFWLNTIWIFFKSSLVFFFHFCKTIHDSKNMMKQEEMPNRFNKTLN